MARIYSMEEVIKNASEAQKQRLQAAAILCSAELKEFWEDEEDWERMQKSLEDCRRKMLKAEEPSTDEEELSAGDEVFEKIDRDVLNEVNTLCDDHWCGIPDNADPWVEPLPVLLRSKTLFPYEDGLNRYFVDNCGIFGVRVKAREAKMHGWLYRMKGECPIHYTEHHSNNWVVFAHADNKKNDWYSCHHGDFELNKRFMSINVSELEYGAI